MLAADTNVIVRYLTRDDPRQAAQASTYLEGGGVFVLLTVLLEAEWVLRSVYGYAPSEVAGALSRLAGLPGIMVEDATAARLALNWLAEGLDFADALHLARAQACDAFVSFDRKLARSARKLQGVRVCEPSHI